VTHGSKKGRAMAYLDWNPAYDTGVAGIDYEHQRLVALLNEIYGLILNAAEPHKIAGILADFHARAAAHFALEEKIMHDRNFPGLRERRDTHYRLLDQVREIMDGYEVGAYRAGANLPETLKTWLSEAMDIDVKLFAEIEDANLRAWGLRRA
jgi:hemerythrin